MEMTAPTGRQTDGTPGLAPSSSTPEPALASVMDTLDRMAQALVELKQQLASSGGAQPGSDPMRSGMAGTATAGAATANINIWEDDPFSEAIATRDPRPGSTASATVPRLSNPKLALRVVDAQPAPGRYTPGTPEFRYWTTVEALSRAVNFWAPLLPRGTTWSSANPMNVTLVAGQDLNANYSRAAGLRFYHQVVKQVDAFSCESPDVACHEMGHAVLDALRPELFNAASIEAAAFHESFGDMSSMLSALQLPSLRSKVLSETRGQLNVNSRLSRLAEQLGWAIRQLSPTAVDPDCLRNAANRFVYQPPSQLPASAPAARLSRQVHSFSRVFTGAFLDALSRMFKVNGAQGEPALLATSRDMGSLLVDGVRNASITPAYFTQVAAAMVQADKARFRGRYHEALSSAFAERGILSVAALLELAHASLPQPVDTAPAAALGMVGIEAGASLSYLYNDRQDDTAHSSGFGSTPELPLVTVSIGGSISLAVHAPAQEARFHVEPDMMGFAAGLGREAAMPQADDAALLFVNDLIRAGRVQLGGTRGMFSELVGGTDVRKHTHVLAGDGDGAGAVLKREHFDCGCCR